MKKTLEMLHDVLKSIKCLFRMFGKLIHLASGYTILVVLISVISGFLVPLSTLLMAQAASQFEPSGSLGVVFILLIALIALSRLLGAVFAQVSALFEAKIACKATVPLKREFRDLITSLGIRYRELPEFDRISQMASVCTNDRALVNNMRRVLLIISGLVSIVGSITILATAGWVYPVLLLTLTILATLVSFDANAKRIQLKFESISDVQRAARMFDNIREKANAAEMRASHRGDWAVSRWKALNETAARKVQCFEMRAETAYGLSGLLFSLGGIALATLYLFAGNGLGGADIVYVIGAVTSVSAACSGLVDKLAVLSFTGEGIRYYFKLFDEALPHVRGEEHNTLPVGICAHDISFSYDAEKNAVDGVTLDISPGEWVAIVGENGSGKTTLAKLLLGIYEPDSGKICFMDANGTMRNSRATTVLQDYCKYELRIRENIGMSDYVRMDDDEALKDSYRSICGDELFAGLNDVPSAGHYLFANDVMDGRELSGGQWQRLALARAYFRKTPLIVLDEPNASIDAFAEAAMIKRIFAMSGNRTCVFITHRLTTTALSDRIIVMKNGRICEMGTHDELLLLGHEYAQMFAVQKKPYIKH